VNRAVRRQQRAAEAKQKAGASGTPKGGSAMPRTSTASKAQRAPRSEKGIRRFIPRFGLDIYSELSKVVWPSREDTLYMAVVVVIVTIIFGAILGGIDFFFAYVIDKAILDPNALFR